MKELKRMNRRIWYIGGIVAIGLVALIAVRMWGSHSEPAPTHPDIQISQPLVNAKVTSPITITGQAKGEWYFEASFPIKLLNAKNEVIAQTPAHAEGDWMTASVVPFTASLAFPKQPAGSRGQLVFAKDNPSGDPRNGDSYSMAVRF